VLQQELLLRASLEIVIHIVNEAVYIHHKLHVVHEGDLKQLMVDIKDTHAYTYRRHTCTSWSI
jgi:hypothetical protein